MLLNVQNLSITTNTAPLVHSSSFQLKAGKTLCVVGESGSGKSLTALSIMGLLPDNLEMTVDDMTFQTNLTTHHSSLTTLTPKQRRNLRGKDMGMIFQEPLSALNPVMTIGAQIGEVYKIHTKLSKKNIQAKVIAQLTAVQLPNPAELYSRYPHQLSGGQRQRVMIAMAMALKPKLLIADEPTTALDATVQAEILQLMKTLQAETGTAILLITHDFGVAKLMADDIAVMEHGYIVEQGRAQNILQNPKQAYTKRLLAAAPKLHVKKKTVKTGNTLLTVKHLRKTYNPPSKLAQILLKQPMPAPALGGVSLTLKAGQTLGVVGESGSGKSTLAKCILQLEQPDGGVVEFNGQNLVGANNKTLKQNWRDIQMVFQDPFASLNPRQTVGESILEGLKAHNIGTKAERTAQTAELLADVGLNAADAAKFPHQFSGGQRQRIVLARALAMKPKLVIMDEAVASLDVSVQAQVLQVFQNLQKKYNLSYLFISHDLRVVSQVADEVIVMHKGQVVEHGATHQIFTKPVHSYTQQLLASLPAPL